MGNLQTWSILLGVLFGASLLSFLGLVLLILVLVSRAGWRRSALRGGTAGVILVVVALVVGQLGIIYAAEERAVPLGYSPLHGGVTTLVLFLMLFGLPGLSLGFSTGAGIGYVCHRPRRAAAKVSHDEDD